MIESGDGSLSRKDAIANGVPPASFARYVSSNRLVRIRRGVYAKDGAVDDLFQLQRRYQRIVYSGITALYLLRLTDRIPDSIEFTIPKECRVRKESIGCNAICHIENNEELFHLGNVSAEPCSGTTSLAIQRKRWLWR